MASDLRAQLEPFYQELKQVILCRQHPVTGLFPASTAINEHGNYMDAWVRDNVYSVLSVWGLSLAYRQLDHDAGRRFELEHATIKCMRALLFAMMKQAHKVEAFKHSQHPLDALHAKYDTATADPVVADDAWGHLQLDATALFLLMLAQMITSGLNIIYTLDEVNFVQNLIYYIARAYRTPDYGIWERGDKTNHGEPELNASSLAMAKAALEALAGFNLFGINGGQPSVVHVLPDDIARARITLETLLPRESSSKEIDAALLSAISYPAFAVDNQDLQRKTHEAILSKLSGRYGLKRFLRDGHQTVIEDPHRLHYEAAELRQFEHIESEWPLFFTYLALDGAFRGDRSQLQKYLSALQRIAVTRDGVALLPELYFVPKVFLEAERANPGSQERIPNDNLPLVWAQSLFLLGRLLEADLITPFDLDPLGRHRHTRRTTQPMVQINLLTEHESLQQRLASHGIETQVPEELAPVRVRRAADLAKVYAQVGRNDALKLSGRPPRRALTLSTSRIYRIGGEMVVFPPAFLDQQEFYLSLDVEFLVARFRSELAYIHRNWSSLGRPTVTFLISDNLFTSGQDTLLRLLHELSNGMCNGVPVKPGALSVLVHRATHERIDDLHGFHFSEKDSGLTRRVRYLQYDLKLSHPLSPEDSYKIELERDPVNLGERLLNSQNLYEQIELLSALERQLGLEGRLPDPSIQVAELLEEVYTEAAECRLWGVVRYAAGLLKKVDVALSESVTEILVAQKSLVIGKAYTERSLIQRPLPQEALLEKIREFCREDMRDRVLTQEILIYLGLLIKAEPTLFRGFLTIRVGHLIVLLTSELARELAVTQDEAYDQLMHLAPAEIQRRLQAVLASYNDMNSLLMEQESIQVQGTKELIMPVNNTSGDATPAAGWWVWRQREGVLNRVPQGFYPNVWQLMERCKGIIIGDKLDRRNRLESHLILSAMTPGEKNFALRIDHMLNKIASPEYRQLTIEALLALHHITTANPDLMIGSYLVMDIIIGHAVRYHWTERFPERAEHYDREKAAAWADFYEQSPAVTRHYLMQAFHLLRSPSGGAEVQKA
jgi:phosphorylase kinase alpha/beta subunit